MLKIIKNMTLAALASVMLASCVMPGPTSSTPNRKDQFGAAYMVSVLRDQLRHPEVVNQPVVVTTFVDLNNLNKSSIFGRVLAEEVLNELHQAGFTVSEIRKGRDIFIRQELGELILSRDAREVLSKFRARAILAGTYVATKESIIINARLIDINSPLILSSSSYTLKMTTTLEKMLTGESPF
jgi:TolB-like protein